MRFGRTGGQPSYQNVLLNVRWKTQVNSVRFMQMSKCFPTDAEFNVVSTIVEGFDAGNKKHLRDNDVQERQIGLHLWRRSLFRFPSVIQGDPLKDYRILLGFLLLRVRFRDLFFLLCRREHLER